MISLKTFMQCQVNPILIAIISNIYKALTKTSKNPKMSITCIEFSQELSHLLFNAPEDLHEVFIQKP